MRYVIIGAGPAGVVAAETLRGLDAEATITLIGEENEAPYSRMAIPYYLTGKVGEDGTHLRQDPGHWERLRIDHVRSRVTHVTPTSNTVTLDDGRHIPYNQLLIASGARPIQPPIEGLDLPGVHTCWTLADARRIAELATPGSNVVLMGAGFVGTIVLEALALRDVNLTVVEMGDRMVPRMMDDTAGTMLKRWCEAKGVSVKTGTRITRVAETTPTAGANGGKPGFFRRLLGSTPAPAPAANGDSEALSVELSDGTTIPATVVVVSAGVRPNIEFLEGSGITIDKGVLVDDHLRTNHPGVYAAGDVCQGRDMMSHEFHVHAIQPTATEHGRVAAYNMTGHDMPFVGSLNMNVLDTLGLISHSFGTWEGKGDGVRLVDEDAFKYLRLEFDGDRLIGAQTVGTTDHIGALRGLIQTGVPLGPWKETLRKNPTRFIDAYIGTTQG